MKATDLIDNDSLRDDIPDFQAGDELKVHVRVVEGGKERIQVFQGDVIGRQGGGRVWLFLRSADFDADYARLAAAGARFTETPRSEAYGRVVVFEDLYGNRWDLLQYNGSTPYAATSA